MKDFLAIARDFLAGLVVITLASIGVVLIFLSVNSKKANKETNLELPARTTSTYVASEKPSASFVLPAQLSYSSVTPAPESKPKTEVITLNTRNVISFRGGVTSKKVTEVQIALMEMSRKLKADEIIYLVLDTPGGSIDAGNALIDTVKAIPQKVKTITVFAASMGFHFVQSMDERLILPSGVLMSHRAYFNGVSGEVPGEMLVRLNFWLKDLHRMDAVAADRMGLDVAKYQELIRDEYWVNGAESVKDKASDRVVYVKCDVTFDGTTKEPVGSFFGMTVLGVMSKCPVISGVLSFSLDVESTVHKPFIEDFIQRWNNKKALTREHYQELR